METLNFERGYSLRKLYFTRTVFQILWAGSVIATAIAEPAIAAVLLIVYPLWDVACTVYDLNTSALDGSARTSQIINAVVGAATAIGIAFTVFRQPAYAIGIFGVWAFGAGFAPARRWSDSPEAIGWTVGNDLERSSVHGCRRRFWVGRPSRKIPREGSGWICNFRRNLFPHCRNPAQSQTFPGDCSAGSALSVSKAECPEPQSNEFLGNRDDNPANSEVRRMCPC